MLVRNPEGIPMAHETSFPSAYSSSLGVLTRFPFESFQALAERRVPQPQGWQCQTLTNRSEGERNGFWNNGFGFIPPCTGSIMCSVIFRSKSKQKKKNWFAKSQLQNNFFWVKKNQTPPHMKTATESPTNAKYLPILCLRVHLFSTIWKRAQHGIKSTSQTETQAHHYYEAPYFLYTDGISSLSLSMPTKKPQTWEFCSPALQAQPECGREEVFGASPHLSPPPRLNTCHRATCCQVPSNLSQSRELDAQ